MAGSETFGVESGFEERVLEWMNSDAKKRKLKFEARAYGYEITTHTVIQYQPKILVLLKCSHG